MVTEPARPPASPSKEVRIDPTAFFEKTYRIFQKAEDSVGSEGRRYTICGKDIELRFAGVGLIPFVTPALEHLSTRSEEIPSLTVCIWDDVSTQTSMPPPPWAGYGVYTRRGDVRGFSDSRIYISYNWDANALSLLDRQRGLALYWTYNAHRLPSYESSAPLRTILHWWMNQFGFQFVHSGAVGNPQGGVLLAGKGGSGKSTTALTCLDSELMYVSDDYCLISADPEPYASCVYSSAKVNADNIQRVPQLMPTLSNMDRMDKGKEKAVFFLYPYFAKKIIAGFPVRAILLPRVSGGRETSLNPASSVEALKALALSTMSQLTGAGRESLQIMHRLVQQLPCYHLELGTALTGIPDVISALLEKK